VDGAAMPKLSAGLVAYRTRQGHLEVLLVHPGGPFWQHKDAHAWSIPKGECNEDADPAQEAEREFHEELGVEAPDGPRIDLGVIKQASGKVVRAWAVDGSALDLEERGVHSTEFEMEWPPRSGRMQKFPEVDRAEWMTLDVARGRVVKAQAALFDRLVEAMGGSAG
jgi:predicted NUDIX family NTP pyrophosphohydrolase